MSQRKKLGLILAIVAIFFIATLLLVPRFIKLDSFKPELEKQAGKFLNREVSVEKITLQFLPRFGVELVNLKILDRPEFGKGSFLEAAQIELRISLRKLLTKQIYVKKIVVNRPRISIIRNQRGELNISDWYQKSQEKGASEKVGKRREWFKVAGRPLQIDAIRIQDGLFRFEDFLASASGQSISAQLDELEVSVNFEEKRYLLKPSRLRIGKSVLDFSGEMTGDKFQFKFNSPSLELAELIQLFYPLKKFVENRKIHFDGTGRLSGTLESASPFRVQADLDLKNAELKYPGLLEKSVGDKLSIALNVRQIPAGYSIENLLLGFNGGELISKGSLSKDYHLNLALSGKGISLEELSRLVKPLSRYNLRGKMDLDGKLTGKSTRADLLNFIIDQMKLSGPELELELRGMVSNLTAPRVRFELEGKKLDLNRLLKSGKKKSASEVEPLASETEKPAKAKLGKKEPGFLEKVELEGNLYFSQIQYQNYALENLRSSLRMTKGEISFPDLSFNLFQGKVSGPLQLDLSRKKPHYQGNLSLRGVELSELLKNFTKMAGTISGNFDGNLEFSGKGSSWEELKPTLTGRGKVFFRKGSLKSFNLLGSLLGEWANSKLVKNLLKRGLGKSQWQNLKETKFDQAEFWLEIKDGLVAIKDLVMVLPGGEIQAKGKWDFGYRVEFAGELLMEEAASKQIAQELGLSSELSKYLFVNGKRLWLPFKLKGTYPNLTVNLDSEQYGKKLGANIVDNFTKKREKDLNRLLEQFSP